MSRFKSAGRLLLATGLLSAGLGCEREAAPIVDTLPAAPIFESGTVRIETATDTLTLRVEIAESEQQRTLGLMRRPSLEDDAGMIFLFPNEQPASGVFWMFNTLIPLSIAFIDEEGLIGSIHEMEPCTSPYPEYCPNYPSGVPFHSALEVNSGYFDEHGIGVGDRVVLQR